MDKEQFKKLIESMESLENKLDKLIVFARRGTPEPKTSPEESKIFKLCDKKNSIDDIIKKTGKTRTNIRFILSQLKGKGLIKSIKIKNKLVYGKY